MTVRPAEQAPVRILMTADTIGGVWTYAVDLIGALDPRRYAVTLATMGAPLSAQQWQAVADYSHLDVRESTFRLEWMDDPWDDVAAAGEWLLGLAEEVRPQVVHLNGYVHAALPWQAPVLVVAHSCVASWWRAVKGDALPARYDAYYRRVRAGIHAADLVVAPTRAMLAAVVREYGAPAQRIMIANGRNAASFAPAREKEPFIFSMGRLWDDAKNIRTLDKAAANLPWPVHVAGCEEHPSGSRLTLQHAQPLGMLAPQEVAHALSRAAVYALPARYEPFGLSILEAALSGCALVLGDIAGLRENWHRAALFVPPDNDAQLHDALLLLSRDAHLRRRLAAAAYRRAQRFSHVTMARAYAQWYRYLDHGFGRRFDRRQEIVTAPHQPSNLVTHELRRDLS